MTEENKVGQADLDPNNHLRVRFVVNPDGPRTAGDYELEAVLLQKELPEGVVGVIEIVEGEDRKRRYIHMPRFIRECSQVVVNFYDDHESLIKGTGAVASVAGAVALGSLFVMRNRKKHDV